MNNDLISREALKEDLIKFFPIDCLEGIESKTLFNQILTDINNAPTVDTTCPHCDSGYAQGYSDGYLKGIEERPTGEWVEKVETKQIGLDWLTTHEIVCSVCGGSGESDENIFQCWKFCPHCGAKMKGGAE